MLLSSLINIEVQRLNRLSTRAVFLLEGAMKNDCDYYRPIDNSQKVSCLNCVHWAVKPSRCNIEAKVLRNDKTALVHEAVPNPRAQGVKTVFK